MPDRPISPQSRPEEVVVDAALRLRTLAEMVGQDRLREPQYPHPGGARPRRGAGSCAVVWSPGTGQNHLSRHPQQRDGRRVEVTAGPAIERAGDLAAILTNLRQGDILFIDEVHRLGRAVEEVLYPAMEITPWTSSLARGRARQHSPEAAALHVIGATTRLALMTAPAAGRFGAVYRLDFYEVEAVQKIVRRAAGLLQAPITPDGVAEIARRGPDPACGAAPAAPRARLRPGAFRRHHHRPDGPGGACAAGCGQLGFDAWTAPCWAASFATSAAGRSGWKPSPRRCRRSRTPSWMWSSRICSSSASSTARARPDGDAEGLRPPGRTLPRNRRAARIV